MRILYVCTANQCRSPIAERLARALGANATSAGTRAVNKRPMVSNAEAVLAELGGDPSNFRSHRLTNAMVNDADLILTMTQLHRDEVLQLNPRALHKTFTLTEADRLAHMDGVTTVAGLDASRPHSTPGDNEDIEDPLGRELDIFRSTARQILAINEFLIRRITG
ncbi:hypothetical protein ACGFK1_05425 [Mycobacterium sp. NPDC048908]|uniref:arsenate reductase/protein-tyrosine-phosphatase family protein n=1 Tax=Mycobacterium sp. NPDC048908 TaxID=3364292 RepID=UPI0037147495